LSKKGYVALVLAGLGIALLITFFSPLASSSPDGLERVAQDKAFLDKGEKEPPYKLIADYAFPWVGNEDAATILGGIVGVVVVAAFVLTLGVGLRALSRRAAVAGTKAAGPAPPAPAGGTAGRGEQ
jgi:hypothetical protein